MAEIEALFHALTGCEAALVVNNNAAATMLVLAAVLRADTTEVIVSRAKQSKSAARSASRTCLRQSGATLVDIGTTNRTYRRDYEGRNHCAHSGAPEGPRKQLPGLRLRA